MQNGPSDFDLIVLEPERARLTRISRATWHRLERAGDAPPRIQLSPRRVGWRKRDLMDWLDKRVVAA
jgi:predicted DNA-binding transcriptional regulator AlpA